MRFSHKCPVITTKIWQQQQQQQQLQQQNRASNVMSRV